MATVRTAQGTVTFVDLQDGTSRVTLQYFYKTSADASQPTAPQGNFEYNFKSGVLTPSVSTAFDGWSTDPDNLTFSEALWMVSITLEGLAGSTATFDQDDWNGPVVLSRVGFQPTQPDPATSVATVFIFRPKSAAANGAVNPPTKTPTGPFSYDFGDGTLSPTTVDGVTGDLDGWSLDLPAIVPGQYIWVKQATASNTSGTDVIYGAEFSPPTLLSGSGLDGYNTAVVQLYNKNSDASSAPTDPSGNFKHTFSTGLLTAESGADFNGWTQSAPSITNGEYLWVIQGSAVARGTTDLINGTEFGAAQIVGVGGANALPLTVTDTDRDGLNQTITLSDGSTIVISDGNPATNEGVIVVYASNANGADKNLTPASNLQYVRYYEWSGTKPALSEIPNTTNGWVKYVGENATDSGVIPIYSPVANPDENTTLSLSIGSNTYVTFYEWTTTQPTSVPNDAHTNTFVPFVAVSPTISTSYNATTGVTTVTVVDADGSRNFDITDGDPGTSEGVTVIYADDASGTDKNTVRQDGQEYVLYYEWNGIENKPNSDLSNLTGTLQWIKFVGETPNAPPAQGVVPVYSSVQNPSAMNQLSLTLGTKKFVTFYEWTGTRPTLDNQLPSDLYETQTFVQFVADEPDAPDAPDQPDPPPRYYSIRMYSSNATAGIAPAKATLTWSDLSVATPSGWSTTAPTINANTTLTTWYFSDLVFIDTSGVATTSEDVGTLAQKVVSFDGIVTFTNSNGDVVLSDGNTENNATVYADGGSTQINGGRIKTNTIKLSSVENSGGATSGDQSGMILTDDTIKIQDSSGSTRIFIGKLS